MCSAMNFKQNIRKIKLLIIVAAAALSADIQADTHTDKLVEAFRQLSQKFIDNADADVLVDVAIRSMTNSLNDEYTTYRTSEQNQRATQVLERKTIKRAVVLSENIGFVKIEQFGATTADEFAEALRQLIASDVKSLIIDLRGNSGGYVRAAAALLSEVLEAKSVSLKVVDNKGVTSNITTSNARPRFDGEVIILGDEQSASASEMVMAAVQDFRRGVVVGRRTFGKGLVQSTTAFKDGSALVVSTGKWLSPNGRSVAEVGIEPDVVVTLSTDNQDFKNDEDLLRAIALLRNDAEEYKALIVK